MRSGLGFNILAALGIAIGMAILVLAIDRSFAGAVVALFGSVAAVLVAGRRRSAIAAASAPAQSATLQTLDEVLDTIGEPVLLVREGRVLLANSAALGLLGRHIVGEDARIAIRHPAAAERLVSPAKPSDRPIELIGLGTLDQHWQMRMGDTSEGLRIVHLTDQTGNHAAERMRVDFVANASHELRTPLASILGFIETLGDEAGAVPAIRARFLKVMFDEARRMQRLVEDLISLSRIEAEKYRLPSQPVDLADLIRDVCAEIRAAADPRAADLVCDTGDISPIIGDRAQLSQMLHNLVGNAMKYGRAGTPVRIALADDGAGMVRLSVADQGDGIAPDHIPRLTERFYRIDAGRSRTLGGTGLGLAIVKHIVERHRGRLEIASRVGVGTTVTIVVPAASSNRNTGVTRAIA